jgi:hypothetical protein
MKRSIVALTCLSLILCASHAVAADYHVGPGKTYTSIGSVPWESLSAGDTVFIFAKPTPYYEKWVINLVGTASAPLTVRGVPDENGVLPIIHGEGATTRAQLNYWNEERGILKIGGSNIPDNERPQYIVVENLHFRRARGSFTGRYGTSSYNQNAAGVYVEYGDNITVRNCILEDNGNGLFVGHDTNNMVIEGNYIHGNGNPGSIYEHNTYTAARNILYQYNRFGPLCDGCGGNNLKDRSSGTVIRYNWIESGNRQMDLVDCEDDETVALDPAYLTTFVYGNILIEPDGAGNSQILHFGGDSGNEAIYRGTLFFWNNTVISTRTDNTTLIRLSTNAQTAVIQNNIIYVTAAGNRLALTNSAGVLNYAWNLFKPGFVNSHSGLTGSVNDLGGNITAASPGFVDEHAQDFRLTINSPAINAGSLSAAMKAHPFLYEYVPHQAHKDRQFDGYLDLGALEYNTCANLPVRINNAAPGYAKIRDAYYAASAEQIMGIQETVILENLFFNSAKTLKISGGYDCEFGGNSGYSTLRGNLVISSGTVIVDRIIIR